jgi:invasion protein IalB
MTIRFEGAASKQSLPHFRAVTPSLINHSGRRRAFHAPYRYHNGDRGGDSDAVLQRRRSPGRHGAKDGFSTLRRKDESAFTQATARTEYMTTRLFAGRIRARAWIGAAALAAAGVAAAPASAAEQPGQLPGGAQSVTETYQDWQMVCGQSQNAKQCAIAQQQTDSKSGQRILGVELRPQGDKVEGIVLLPFGVTLDKGVALRIGEAELGPALRFKTCLPGGCIAPVNLDAKALAALRKSTALTVSAYGDGDQPIAFTVSLKGFGSALDRATALAR